MNSEGLVIELQTKMGNSLKDIKSLNNELSELDKNAGSSDSNLKTFTGTVFKVGAAATAAATALVSFVTVTAKSRKELQLLSDQARISAGEFESLAFAAKMYGVQAESLSDISKDLFDKIGEYSAVGTGAFQDVADVIGLSKDEAIKFANELSSLTAPQAIQEITNQLEISGATSAQTTFVMESLGNELSRLNPLFKDNGSELAILTARYDEVNGSIGLLASQEKDLARLADTNDMLWEQLGNAGTLISASLAPAVNDFFNGVISIVPDATNAIYDFIDSFKDLENRDSIRALDADIETLEGQIDALQEVINNRISENKKRYGDVSIWDALNPWSSDTGDTSQMQGQLDELNNQLQEFYDRRNEIINAEEEARQARTFESVDFSGNSIDSEESTTYDKDIEALERKLMTEEELLTAQFEKDMETAAERRDLQLELEAKFQQDLLNLRQSKEDAEIQSIKRVEDAEKRARDEILREEKKANKQKIGIAHDYASAALTVGGMLFEDNKAVKAGMVIVDTASAAMKAYSDLGPIAGSAAAASIIATGLAQLASINSATKGGGSVSGGNGIGETSPSASSEYKPEETNELFVSNSDISGQNTTKVIVEFDESTDIGVVLNNMIQKSVDNGDIIQ